VKQPVENGEVLKVLLFNHRCQIELKIDLAANSGTVAQQADDTAIGDKTPKMLGAVEILLQQRVRRKARASTRRKLIKLLPETDNMHRYRIIVLAKTMRDRETHSVDVVGAGVVVQLVAEHVQEWNHPGVTGKRGRRILLIETSQPVLHDAPERTDIVKHCRNLIVQVTTTADAKIFRLLVRQFAPQQLFRQVSPKKTTCNA
jgi:hypothetical protein